MVTQPNPPGYKRFTSLVYTLGFHFLNQPAFCATQHFILNLSSQSFDTKPHRPTVSQTQVDRALVCSPNEVLGFLHRLLLLATGLDPEVTHDSDPLLTQQGALAGGQTAQHGLMWVNLNTQFSILFGYRSRFSASLDNILASSYKASL